MRAETDRQEDGKVTRVVEVVVVAAGSGTRLRRSCPKALVPLCDKPIVVHALEVFQKAGMIDGVVLVCPADHRQAFEELCRTYALSKVRQVVAGGSQRHDSVRCGIAALRRQTTVIAVHDGARPLIREVLIRRLLQASERYEAVIPGVPLKATVKEVDPDGRYVRRTVDRRGLMEIQTPQVFHRSVLESVYKGTVPPETTDDAFLVEQAGGAVKVVEGDYRNIKITTPEDLLVAEAFLAEV